MPDPHVTDEELANLTRAYLTRRRGQPAPRNLESDAVSFAFAHRRTKRLGVVLGAAALVAASALTAGVVLAFHHASQSPATSNAATQARVRIVRFPGTLALPPLDRTIHSATIVRALAADVESLPRYPLDERCPADFGTYYFLTFTFLGSSPLSAKIEAEGCEVVQVPGKPVQWAARSPQLWADLTRALGFDPRNLPPPQSDAGTVAGGIQQLCSPNASTPPGSLRFLAGTIDVFAGSSYGLNAPVYETQTLTAGWQFRLTLPPGNFVIMALDPASYNIGPYVKVTVTPRHTTTANIPFPTACR